MTAAATGLIVAGLDVDIANGAAWNRWYDLEHLAPNLALASVVTGRRYVATPELHASRRVAPDDPAWGSGRGVYLTWYATAVDPVTAIDEMSARRDELETEGRMVGAGARVVRTGDALDLVGTWTAPALRLAPVDAVHVGHAGLRLLLDHDADPAAGGGPGVVAGLRFASRFVPGLHAELQFLEHPAAVALEALRAADPRPAAVLDAGFDPIQPLYHPFLDAIMDSDLPPTIEA